MIENRLLKAIKFFREFDTRSNKELYRKCVLKFCDLVEDFINGKKEDSFETAQEVFKENVENIKEGED